MRTMKKMLKNPDVHTPHPHRKPHSSKPGDGRNFHGNDSYLPDGYDMSFPGPLMSKTMKVKGLLHFIQTKSQQCLQHLDEPNQKEAYFFWKIMELMCNKNGNVLLAEVATVLFKGYIPLRNKLRGGKNQDGWCLPLAQLLCLADPEDDILNAVVKMGETLDSKGLTYAAHICYVVALEVLEPYQGFSFELIGCDSLPVSQSAVREAIERTEVYEYFCFLTSGFAQPNFQIYKYYHASRLAESGLVDQAFDYCKTIAGAIATFPHEITKTTMELTIELSERLHQRKGKEPEWLINLRQLHANDMFKVKDSESGLLTTEMLHLLRPCMKFHITPWEVFDSLYTPGDMLGEGGFGTVCEGVRNADGKQVAMKYLDKDQHDKFITIPGQTRRLPQEVALMQMVSKPYRCENVLELIEWFEMSDGYVLILERPSPCMDLYQFQKSYKCRLSEPLAQIIMHQVVQAARHCCDCGVLHRDIKAENLLVKTDTLEVKLIDFGCGDLLKDTPYTSYEGTWSFFPPEWICEREYLGRPATVWSLGVLLFSLVCGYLPFNYLDDIVEQKMHVAPDLTRGCRDLIFWCLERDPHSRPTFKEILRHEWLTEPQNKVKNLMKIEKPALHLPPLESHITRWEVFDSLYTPGDMQGEGVFGTACAGVRNADGKQVAMKYVAKHEHDKFITIPGETQCCPLEVALMEMVCKPYHCENVLELIEWFEMSDGYVLILERPSPCVDLHQFRTSQEGRLSEPLAQIIMHQVVQAAQHCCDCGVLHRDIKAENLLINPDTLEVKLFNFGCGDLLKDTPYTSYEGTWSFFPPEWIRKREYLGCPATVWSLGVLLFNLVCGYLPFNYLDDIVEQKMHVAPDLSGGCRDLIFWCLERDPHSRPTFKEILRHEWLTEPQNKVKNPKKSEKPAHQLPPPENHITQWEVFDSLYTPGDMLGEGGFGTACAGVRNADGKQVVMKYVAKHEHDKFITIPGETQCRPLEVALMEMVSKPLHCENVLELIEWFEMSDGYVLILERPSPCMDLHQFRKSQEGRLSEPLAQIIMHQVVQAAQHCCDCGVLHRDIKAENLLINPDTLEVKLIDFGCGDLLKDTPYTSYEGTWSFFPPEWICEREYLGRPATVWSLGVLLFNLVCGYLPFNYLDDIVEQKMHVAPDLTRGCRDLIFWCLERDPHSRPTFKEILRHEWLTEPQNKVKNPMKSGKPTHQLPPPESHITRWREFESLYTPRKLLRERGFGTACTGVRIADGKQVAIKYLKKRQNTKFITTPGETQCRPLEVALMEMVSKPFRCENVLELIEWFEMSDGYVLILELPRPCMDLQKFLKHHKGRLSEALAQVIMRQVIQAVRHCCDCGVLQHDIKLENLLINPDTLVVKLISFGCGDLLKDTPYTSYEGTWPCAPPEWVCEREYLGRPATMWNLGVLLFNLVCGYLPFHNEDGTVDQKMHFFSGLSASCYNLIWWCLDLDPDSRPTFEEILSHEWFKMLQN